MERNSRKNLVDHICRSMSRQNDVSVHRKACRRTSWRSRFPDPVPQHPAIIRHASGILVKPRRKCFHILVPVEPIDSETVDSWQGKILEVVKKFRSELKKNEERLIEQISTTQREVAELRKEITKLGEKPNSQAR